MQGSKKPNDFVIFTQHFWRIALVVRQVLLGLLFLIIVFGVVLAFIEDLDIGAGIYFAFVTALTIGYGDIHADTGTGRVLCVLTGIVGMLFTGITVAIANRALHATVEEQMDGPSP